MRVCVWNGRSRRPSIQRFSLYLQPDSSGGAGRRELTIVYFIRIRNTVLDRSTCNISISTKFNLARLLSSRCSSSIADQTVSPCTIRWRNNSELKRQMMAHVAPAEYAFHGREGPYNAARPLDYYSGREGDPSAAAFHRPLTFGGYNAVADDDAALADVLAGIDMAPRGRQGPSASNKDLVVQAIEAASSVLRDQASALREQLSENERLRSELRVREWELHNYRDQGQGLRQGDTASHNDFQQMASMQPVGASNPERRELMQGINQLASNKDLWVAGDPNSSLIVHPGGQTLPETYYRYSPNGLQGPQYGSGQAANGLVRGRSQPMDGGFSRASSPSARSTSPIRRGREGESDARMVLGGQGNMQQFVEANRSNGLCLQDLVQSAPRQQEEIKHLKQLLSDATLKERQMVRENQRLETRLTELRLTIEKYQQDLVDASSSAMAMQQGLLEKIAQLRSGLAAADQDRSIYASSLVPLLAEFNLQPVAEDPHSIISGIKALVQPLRDEFRKDPLASKPSWRTSPNYQPSHNYASPSPRHPMSRGPQSPERHGLEIVPRGAYLQSERPLSPTSPLRRDWDMQVPMNQHHPFGTISNDYARHPTYPGLTSGNQQHNEDYANGEDELNTSTLPFGQDLPEKHERLTPQLPTLPEEPTSSHSDDDDPLPDIDGLTFNGEAVLGNTIIACGISINGTTLCHFQWVRHHRDGSFMHIQGAAQPAYTITADDLDTLLSLECTPMDDRNRKGEMVQVFANNRNWITLEPQMKEQLMEYADAGQASFEVKIVVENPQDISLEPASLTLKRSHYELKRANGRKVVATDRYTLESSAGTLHYVDIQVGKDSQCAIISHSGNVHLLECEDNRTRDLLVLAMREFVRLALDRKGPKKKGWMLTKK